MWFKTTIWDVWKAFLMHWADPTFCHGLNISTSAESALSDPVKFLFQISDFHETFLLYDNRGDGKIPVSMIGDVIRALGQNPTGSEVKKLVQEHRADDRVTFEVFLPIFQVSCTHSSLLSHIFGSFSVLSQSWAPNGSPWPLQDYEPLVWYSARVHRVCTVPCMSTSRVPAQVKPRIVETVFHSSIFKLRSFCCCGCSKVVERRPLKQHVRSSTLSSCWAIILLLLSYFAFWLISRRCWWSVTK